MRRSQEQQSTMTITPSEFPACTAVIDGVFFILSSPTHKEENEERKEEEAIKKQDQEDEKEMTGEAADIEPSFSYVMVGSEDEDGKPWQPPRHISPTNAPRFSSASLVERVAMKN
jgi:hypothetical protein